MEKYSEQIKTRSGTTYKKEMFDRIDDSRTAAQSIINVLKRIDFAMLSS